MQLFRPTWRKILISLFIIVLSGIFAVQNGYFSKVIERYQYSHAATPVGTFVWRECGSNGQFCNPTVFSYIGLLTLPNIEVIILVPLLGYIISCMIALLIVKLRKQKKRRNS